MSTSHAAEFRELLAQFDRLERMRWDELLEAVTSLGDLQSQLDAVKVRIAGDLIRRMSEPDDQNPVRRSGHTSPTTLLAERWRVALPAARQLCTVGSSTGTQLSLIGESLPARYPVLAEALTVLDGNCPARSLLSVDQVAVIVRELDKAATTCSRDAVAEGERLLVEHAPGLTVEEVRVLAAQVRDRLDQDGILPREERQRRRRSLTISTTVDGMTHVDWYLDPESAGYVVTALDAVVGRQLRKVAFHDGDDAMPESRSLPQIRSDSATDVFRHFAACSTSAESGSPVVLGGAGEVLDFGRGRRLFSRAQKLAIAERDGGCAWAGCPHPPSYTEAHHIRWWTAHGGSTDVGNGILLCSSHHHRVHADGWNIEIREHVPWFIPPPHVDPYRRPRRGGRVVYPSERTAAMSWAS